MSDQPTIETNCTPETVCPYCGYESQDSWELGNYTNNDGEIECGKCEKTYRWNRYIDVTYNTRKMP